MQSAWWPWLLLGIVLSLLELALPAFFLLSFGLGALGAGVLAWLAPALPFHVLAPAWLLLAALALYGLRRRFGAPTAAGRTDDGYTGATGVVEEETGPQRKGRIRFAAPILSSTVWDCVSGDTLRAGETARVTGISGHLLHVEKSPSPADPGAALPLDKE